MLEILYDICFEKNFRAIDELKDIYQYQFLINIIIEDGYNYNLKEIMCKILNILWVDTYSYHKIKTPNPIKIWSQLDKNSNDFDILIQSNKKAENYSTLINYIQSILHNDKIENLNYLKSILNLVKTMIEFGFCNNIKTFTYTVSFIKKLFSTLIR